jgi:hypothetical protein
MGVAAEVEGVAGLTGLEEVVGETGVGAGTETICCGGA